MTRHAASAVLVIALVSTPARGGTAAEGRSEPKALRLVGRLEKAMGGRAAWEGTRYLQWSFFGRRDQWWDRATGDVRTESGQTLTLLNVNTREGRAFRDGVELEGDALRAALERGLADWANDAWWLAMPWMLEDPGVVLAHGGTRAMEDGRRAEVLRVTFRPPWPTPRHAYEVFVSKDTRLVEQWSFFPAPEEPRPRFTREFTGWQRFGRVLLATRRGGEEDWRIAAPARVPREVFTDPTRLSPLAGRPDRPAR